MSGQVTAERYVAGGMTPEEVAEFEARMLADEALAADVDVRQRIRAGLEHLRDRGELDALLKARSRPVSSSWAMAAGVVLLVFAGVALLWRDNVGSGAAVELLASLDAAGGAASGTVMLAVTRARGDPVEIRLRAKDPPLQIRVLPDAAGKGPFTVSLAGESVVIPAAHEGFLDVYLRAATPGSHELTLTVAPQNGPRQSHALRVVVIP